VAHAPAYTYFFDHTPSFKIWGSSICQKEGYVCHGAELPFVFHSAGAFNAQFTEPEKALSDSIMNYWVNFAKYQNPNGGVLGTTSDNIWQAFNQSDGKYQVLMRPDNSIQTDPYKKICKFWDAQGYAVKSPLIKEFVKN
jgi:carboxylesterase type B